MDLQKGPEARQVVLPSRPPPTTYRLAGNALGAFVAKPRLMPNGSSLHYQGTVRMGETDDWTSVADLWSRMWGYGDLVVGGNVQETPR